MITVTNKIDLLLWTLMVHLQSQWWVIKLVVYLEVIVSEVVRLDSSDRLIGSGSVMTRLVSYRKEIRYHLNTLPWLVVIHTLDIWHPTFNIILSILALAWQLTLNKSFEICKRKNILKKIFSIESKSICKVRPGNSKFWCKVITIRVITLKMIALSDHNFKNCCKKIFSIGFT